MDGEGVSVTVRVADYWIVGSTAAHLVAVLDTVGPLRAAVVR
jgi:hypothetical protein